MKKKICISIIIILIFTLSSICVNAEMSMENCSIENDPADTKLEDTENLGAIWEGKCGVEGSSYAKIAEDDGGKYVDMEGIYAIISYDSLTSPSEFALELRTDRPSAYAGVCFRTGNVFNLYEWDFHTEKGGQDGMSSIGATGVVLSPIEGGIRLSVKTQDDNSTWGISSVYHDFMIDGIDYSEFVPIRIKDDGTDMQIYVKETLLASVHMENEGEYEEDFDTEIFEYLDFSYYKSVTVNDAQGSEVIKTDRARLVSQDYYAGAAVREASIHLRNIELGFDKKQTSGNTPAPATPLNESSAAPTQESPKQTDSATSSPVRTNDVSGNVHAGTVTPPSLSDTEQKGTSYTAVIIAAAIVSIIAIAVIVIFVRKGKKRKEQ